MGKESGNGAAAATWKGDSRGGNYPSENQDEGGVAVAASGGGGGSDGDGKAQEIPEGAEKEGFSQGGGGSSEGAEREGFAEGREALTEGGGRSLADVAEDWIQATNRGRAASRVVREAEGMGGGPGVGAGSTRVSPLDVDQQVRCGEAGWFTRG